MELVTEFGVAACIHPIEPGDESVLGFVPCSIASAVERMSRDPLTGTRFATMKSMNSATPACLAPGRVIFRNDHLGEVLDHAVVLGREEKAVGTNRTSKR